MHIGDTTTRFSSTSPRSVSGVKIGGTGATSADCALPALRAKSERLTGYLEQSIRAQLNDTLQIVTPASPQQRGCQLSLRVIGGRERGRALFEHLGAHGVLGDWREPDVIRISPAPLYNSFADVLRFARTVKEWDT